MGKETEQMYVGGKPFCPRTNYEEDDAAERIKQMQELQKNTIVGIKKNGEDVSADSEQKVNIVVPTKVSELDNDKKFIAETEGIIALGETVTVYTETAQVHYGTVLVIRPHGYVPDGVVFYYDRKLYSGLDFTNPVSSIEASGITISLENTSGALYAVKLTNTRTSGTASYTMRKIIG